MDKHASNSSELTWSDHTPTMAAVHGCLKRFATGDESAKDEALGHAYHRLTALSGQMMRKYQRLQRWEEESDVLQNAMIRFDRALRDVKPTSVRAFYGLAALQIRRELIDLSRRYFGALGTGRHHATDAGGDEDGRAGHVQSAASPEPGPATQAESTEVHAVVEKLPEAQREVFDLLHYNGLSQVEAAEVLGVSSRTIKRRWREARIQLAQLIE